MMNKSLQELVSQASKKDLEELICQWAQQDTAFYNTCMSALGAPAVQCTALFKEQIQESIRLHTHRGYIDMYGCDQICYDIDDVMEKTQLWTQDEERLTKLDFLCWVLRTCMFLASNADSSSGSLSMTIQQVQSAIAENVQDIRQNGSVDDRRAAFSKLLHTAKDNAFSGWTDMQCELLCTASLAADNTSKQSLYGYLNLLMDSAIRSEHTWDANTFTVTRFRIMQNLEPKDTAEQYLMNNLSCNELRQIAIAHALDEQNYEQAERLCLDKRDSRFPHCRATVWEEELFRIYTLWDHREKMTAQARCLYLMGKAEYYPILKKLLQQDGRWAEAYPLLREEAAKTLSSYAYGQMLAAEQDTARLMETVRRSPGLIFNFGELLGPLYPGETKALCTEQIRKMADEAGNRREYQRVCSYLLQMANFVGWENTCPVLTALAEAYPRRSALLDELNKLQNAYIG